MITPAVDWSKCVNEVLLPIDKNSSVPSLEILNEFPSVIVDVVAPCSIILPSPRLILASVEESSKLFVSNSKSFVLISKVPPANLM